MARKSRKSFETSRPTEVSLQDVISDSVTIMPTAAYGRLSNENSGYETDDSLKTQMDIIYRYIDEHPELKLAGSYMDNGYTGTNFDRPDFHRLMDDVKRGRISCIVVKDLSRFGRDYLETGYYLETILPHLNVRLIAINDNYDSFRKSDRDNLSVPIKNMVNAMYSKDLSRKICASAEARRKRTDVVPNGNAPYGYEISEDRTHYEIDPEAAVYIRTLFQWKRMGLTTDEIAKRMNLMDVPVPTDYRDRKIKGKSNGRTWAHTTVNTILKNQVYAGDTVMGKLRQSLYKSEECRKVPREEWTIYENTHEPLVSRADLAEINSKAKYEKTYANRFKPYNIIARESMNDQLTGLVYCKECGCRMNYVRYRNDYSVATPEEISKELRGEKNGISRTEYYWCPPDAGKAKCGGHRISADLLKIVLMDQLDFQIHNMTDLNKLMVKIRNSRDGKDPFLSTKRKLTAAKTKLLETEEQIVRLYEDFADGTLEAEDYQMLKGEKLKKKEQTQRECNNLEQNLKKQEVMLDRLGKTARELAEIDTSKGFDEDLIHRMVEKIEVSSSGNIEIKFVFRDVINEVSDLLGKGGRT